MVPPLQPHKSVPATLLTFSLILVVTGYYLCKGVGGLARTTTETKVWWDFPTDLVVFVEIVLDEVHHLALGINGLVRQTALGGGVVLVLLLLGVVDNLVGFRGDLIGDAGLVVQVYFVVVGGHDV